MSQTLIRFVEYVQRVWLGQLPMQLSRAILVALLFQVLIWLRQRWIQHRLRPVLLRDAGDSPANRVHRRRLLLAVPGFLSAAVLYVLAVLILLRIFGMRTGAELLPLALALVVVGLVAFWRPLRDAAQGYLVLYDHLYTRGERVIIGGQEGLVVSIGLRWTHLHTDEGAEVIIPHSQVGQIINLSRGVMAPASGDAGGQAGQDLR